MVLVLFTGFLAGIVHVLSGPDHVAAVAPFSAERRSRNWIIGFLWGVGHSIGVWIIGILFFLLRDALPLETLSSWSETLVGSMLIGIGLWGIHKASTQKLHYHEHNHKGVKHAHFHLHRNAGEHHHSVVHQHSHAPLGIGLLHGLAGSSHLFGVIPALMFPAISASISYIIGFGLGAIIAMSFFSWLVGRFVNKLNSQFKYGYNVIMMSFAILSISVGVTWLYLHF